MHQHTARRGVPRAFEHGGPKEGVEVDDVFANDVVNFGVGVVPVGIKVAAGIAAEFFSGGHIANRRIEPNVKIFIIFAGNFKTEIGTVAADIPVAQPFVEPILQKPAGLRIEPLRRVDPRL